MAGNRNDEFKVTEARWRELMTAVRTKPRDCRNVIIRMAGDNLRPNQYYDTWVGNFTDGNEGVWSLSWPALKSWMASAGNKTADRPAEANDDDIRVTLLEVDGHPRREIDHFGLQALLRRWEEGTLDLALYRGLPSIEVENINEEVLQSVEDDYPPIDTIIPIPGASRYPTRQRQTGVFGNKSSTSGASRDASKGRGRDRDARPWSLSTDHDNLDTPLSENPVATHLGGPNNAEADAGVAGGSGRDKGKRVEKQPTPAEDAGVAGGSGRDKGKGKEVEKEPTPAEDEVAIAINNVLEDLEVADYDRKLDKDVHWTKVKQFFKIPGKKTNQWRLPGLMHPMEGYQAAAVLWLLTRLPEDKVAGPMLSDDMGLGKTFTIIVTIMVHNYLHEAYEDVKKSWEHERRMEERDRNRAVTRQQKKNSNNTYLRRKPDHNPKDAAPGTPCPSASSNLEDGFYNEYGIQCPCEVGSTARSIVENMSDLPSIIICPSQGATIWTGEWEKFVDPTHALASKLRLYVNLTGYGRGRPDLAAFCEDMENAQGGIQGEYVVEENKLWQRLYGFRGGSRNVLLLTAEGCGALKDKVRHNFLSDVAYTGPGGRQRPRYRELGTVPVTGCAIMAMDEVHTYKGSRSSLTLPFQALELFKFQDNPTLAVGVSGNLRSLGPNAWENMVAHTQAAIRRHNLKAQLGRLQTRKSFDELKRDWNILQSRISRYDWLNIDEAEVAKIKLTEDFKQGIGKMLVRRTKKDYFRKERILHLADAVFKPMPLKIPQSPALTVLNKHFTQIGEWLNRIHKENVEKWKRNGQEGEEPTLAKTQHDLLNGETPVALAEPKTKGRPAVHWESFNISIRAMTYPEIARIPIAQGADALRSCLDAGKPLSELATEFTNATLDPRKTDDTVIAMLNNSPFLKYRISMGTGGSPKFQRLCEIVRKELLDTRLDRLPRVYQDDSGPTDDSFVRHMVVFADSPITAYLTAFFLQLKFKDKVEVLLIHAGLNARTAAKGKYWNSRETAFAMFRANCRKTDPNKILVGTFQLISTMQNFQRASSAVLLDVPTVVQRSQAIDRINRWGQPGTARITEMWYENHVYENYRRQRNEGNRRMAEIDFFRAPGAGGTSPEDGPAEERPLEEDPSVIPHDSDSSEDIYN